MIAVISIAWDGITRRRETIADRSSRRGVSFGVSVDGEGAWLTVEGVELPILLPDDLTTLTVTIERGE